MVLNVTFNDIQLYRGGQFYWWRIPEYPVIFFHGKLTKTAVNNNKRGAH
jgi:hypothetical protein